MTKRRPALVVSSDVYHTSRPDVILGLITSRIQDATAPTDYLLLDWKEASLHHPSAFRAYLVTLPYHTVSTIGKISERDWQVVQSRIRKAIALGPEP